MTGCAPFKVVLAGGGTGGHVIPAIAIAQEVVRRGGEASFVGTRDRIEARLVPQAGFHIDFIKARPLAGGGARRLVAGAAYAPLSVVASRKLLKRAAPDAVIGVGGYVAGPVVLAAKIMGIKTALLEQNATVGLANRLLARLVTRAFVTYDDTAGAFPAGRAIVTGNPVKAPILEAARTPRAAHAGAVRVLVMGGSQGALAIDRRVPEAMRVASLAGLVEVVHQCGGGRVEEVRAAYAAAGIEATVVPFIDDTASAFRSADLVVARSGATTVSELTVMGLPAIFLPYPHHRDRQQEKNAAPMAQGGAAIVLDEKVTGAAELAMALDALVRDPAARSRAAEASAALGRPDAARQVVDGLLGMIGAG
jgi:UDP-N-acetylglucosamine--N-acetylmuramyl-(pentapeptide) pyrophosphoryl-undecaprenol N-acetylglucosamine transferase